MVHENESVYAEALLRGVDLKLADPLYIQRRGEFQNTGTLHMIYRLSANDMKYVVLYCKVVMENGGTGHVFRTELLFMAWHKRQAEREMYEVASEGGSFYEMKNISIIKKTQYLSFNMRLFLSTRVKVFYKHHVTRKASHAILTKKVIHLWRPVTTCHSLLNKPDCLENIDAPMTRKYWFWSWMRPDKSTQNSERRWGLWNCRTWWGNVWSHGTWCLFSPQKHFRYQKYE